MNFKKIKKLQFTIVFHIPLKENSNLNAINIRSRYDCPIGYSDHTNGIASPLYSIAVGSRIIEKHFKIDEDCVDASVSIDGCSKKMITEIKNRKNAGYRYQNV